MNKSAVKHRIVFANIFIDYRLRINFRVYSKMNLLRCCFRGFLVLFTLAIIGLIEYSYYCDYLISAFGSEHRSWALFDALINGILVFMLLWSLLATYFTNPGYVLSYITSRKINQTATQSIYNIYLKSKGVYQF